MRSPREAEKERKAGRRLLLPCLACLGAAFCFVAAGCSSPNKKAGDPLFGELHPKGTGPGYNPGGTNKSELDVPPIPSANSNTSTAALAAGDLPGSRTLAIATPTDSKPAPGWQNGQAALTGGTKDQPAATLSRPEPLVQPIPRAVEPTPVTPVSNPAPAPAANADAGAGTVNADPNLLAQLRSRGVTYQRAVNVAGGVEYSCIVTNPQNPGTSHFYKTVGPNADAAVRAVLWQIDHKK
jgi:hypothetical protein